MTPLRSVASKLIACAINEYPSAFAWYEERYFPNHVPVPIPPSIYYFHNQFRDGDAATREWLTTVAQYEFALMFTALWWHDARRGGVGVVVPYDTVTWLEELLEDCPIDPNSDFGRDGGQTDAGYIFARMRDVANAARHTRNNCRFPRFPHLRESQFVWTDRQGFPDRERVGGRHLYRDPRNLRE